MHYLSSRCWGQVSRIPVTGWIVLFCATFANTSYGQDGPRVSITPRVRAQPDDESLRIGTFRTGLNRVLIPVSVANSYGRPVHGLEKKDFRLLENGVEQQLVDFFVEDGPISVGVVLDGSTSMRDKLLEARQTVTDFLRLSTSDDESFLVTFHDEPKLVRGFTKNLDDIDADLSRVQPFGWTALYDAMAVAINHMKRASHGRRVLLVLSDGGDNNSRFNTSEMKNLVREANVRILWVSVQGHAPAVEKLAAESGGRSYHVRNAGELPALAATLSAEAHAEYVLGYTPNDRTRDGKYHPV